MRPIFKISTFIQTLNVRFYSPSFSKLLQMISHAVYFVPVRGPLTQKIFLVLTGKWIVLERFGILLLNLLSVFSCYWIVLGLRSWHRCFAFLAHLCITAVDKDQLTNRGIKTVCIITSMTRRFHSESFGILVLGIITRDSQCFCCVGHVSIV
jgi:hypothetical protein